MAVVSWDCPAGSEQKAVIGGSQKCTLFLKDKAWLTRLLLLKGRWGGGVGVEIEEEHSRESVIIYLNFKFRREQPPPPNLD